MNQEGLIKNQLTKHLQGGKAFTSLSHFLNDIPYEAVGKRPYDLPYSIFELFYHMHIAQQDIMNFSMGHGYETKNWPDDYWPSETAPKSKEEWKELKAQFFEDRNKLASWLKNEDNNILDIVKNGEDQTCLREILLVIEHNAYHTGQLFVLCRLLGVKNN
jgi:uncharacterized damage-inducible protein DinB